MEKIKNSKHLVGFREFIRERGVVGLAAGIIIGTAVTALVRSLVDDIINPLIGIVIGKVQRLDQLIFHFYSAEIRVGHFLSTLIDFIVVSAVVYIMVKMLKLEKLDMIEAKKSAKAGSKSKTTA